MKTFEYQIKDELGIHARPAGMLAKIAKEFSSEITITKENKSALCTKLMALMGLGARQGDIILVMIDGVDEEEAEKAVKEFLEENL